MICTKWKPRVRELSSGQLELSAKDGPLPLETAQWGPGQEPETRGRWAWAGFRSSFLNPPLEFILFVMSCIEIITDSQEIAKIKIKKRLQGGPMYLSPSSPNGHVTRTQRLDRGRPSLDLL